MIDPDNARERLAQSLEIISVARKNIDAATSAIRSELSRLPNLVPPLAPNDGGVWFERLIMLEHLVSTGKASWQRADHHLANITSVLTREVIEN